LFLQEFDHLRSDRYARHDLSSGKRFSNSKIFSPINSILISF
jgi:hypothetical protein